MFTVALIGADGAGKTTIGRRLEHALPMPVKYVYMGVNLDASNHVLPTTRLLDALNRLCGAKGDKGPPDPTQEEPRPRGVLRRIASSIKGGIGLMVRLSEEWFRQGITWFYRRRGYIVVFDRHFFADYYFYDIAKNGHARPLRRRLHGFLLQHVYPRPDLVIYLDAPAEVLFARKREGTLAALEHRRQEYLNLRSVVKHFVIVDASRSQDEVTREVAGVIEDYYRARTGKIVRVPNAAG